MNNFPKLIKSRSSIRPVAQTIQIVLWLSILLFSFSSDASSDKTNSAKIKISGYGLFDDRALKTMLKSLEAGEKKREFYDANFIEDAALILLSRLKQDGYLKPEVEAKLTLADGKAAHFSWKENIGEPLPRAWRARKIEFKLKKGVLYRYGTIDFKGLKSLREKEGKGFFVERGVLVPLKKTRVFTPQKLERSVSSLREVLARKGFETATV
ncbi:MAG: POTRA domain-containing protein, partial [Limisphaerales bacterium]